MDEPILSVDEEIELEEIEDKLSELREALWAKSKTSRTFRRSFAGIACGVIGISVAYFLSLVAWNLQPMWAWTTEEAVSFLAWFGAGIWISDQVDALTQYDYDELLARRTELRQGQYDREDERYGKR